MRRTQNRSQVWFECSECRCLTLLSTLLGSRQNAITCCCFPVSFFNKKSNKISLFSNWHSTFGALSLLLFVNIYFSLRYCWFALPLSYDNSLCLATGASIFIDQRSFGASFYVLASLSLSILLLSGNVGAFLRCFCALQAFLHKLYTQSKIKIYNN